MAGKEVKEMVNNGETKVIYKGDGKTKVFPYTFAAIDVDTVKVAIYDETTDMERILTKDYYVDAVAKTVTYPGYAPGQEPAESQQPGVLQKMQRLIIYRETPLDQLQDLGAKYPLPIVEAISDKLTMIVQELKEQVDRSIKNSISGAKTFVEYMKEIDNNAKTALKKALEAAASAVESHQQAEDAAGSAKAAQESAAASAGWNEMAAANARVAENAALSAAVYSAPEWQEAAAYKAGDIVTYTDGNTYRAIADSTDILPNDAAYWTRVNTYVGDNFFCIDEAGYIVPTDAPIYSGFWALDTEGYIVPIRSA